MLIIINISNILIFLFIIIVNRDDAGPEWEIY